MQSSISSAEQQPAGSSSNLERLKDLAMQYVPCQRDAISLDSSFTSLGLDSLETSALLMDIEDQFGVCIPLTRKIATVKDVLTYLD